MASSTVSEHSRDGGKGKKGRALRTLLLPRGSFVAPSRPEEKSRCRGRVPSEKLLVFNIFSASTKERAGMRAIEKQEENNMVGYFSPRFKNKDPPSSLLPSWSHKL